MKIRENKGFTLIELLVSLGVSSLLLLCASALALSYSTLFRNELKDSRTLFIIGKVQEQFYQKNVEIEDRFFLENNSIFFLDGDAEETCLLFSDITTISDMTTIASEDNRSLKLNINYLLSGKAKTIEMIRIIES